MGLSNMSAMDNCVTKAAYSGVKTHLWFRLFNQSRGMRYWLVKLNHHYNEYSISFIAKIIIKL